MPTLHVEYRTQPFAAFTAVDIVASGFAKLRIHRSVDDPATATWIMYAPHHTMPIPIGAYIRIWDSEGTDPDGDDYSDENPLFVGHVVAPSPTEDANVVAYQAFDPTYKASISCNVMSTAWQAGDVSELAYPIPAATAYPRLIMNATIQSDEDWVYSRGEGLNLGQMISNILSDQYHPLYWADAAPGDGSDAGNGFPFVQDDLDALDYVPTDKFVSESEHVRSAIERILSDEPTRRILFHPSTQQWRIYDLTAAPQVDLTLNDFSGDHQVLTISLQRSLEGRFTAVKIYGPERHTGAIASTADGSLVTLDAGDILLETVGSREVLGRTRFQVTDSAKRKIASFLPNEILVPVGGYYWIPVRSPSFQVSYDGGNTWGGALGPYYDFYNGIIYTSVPAFFHQDPGRVVSDGVQKFFTPTHHRLVYAYLDTPMFTRYPASGYEGTAYSIGGLRNEMHVYDEQLAVGKNWFGTPVTTEARLGEYYKLATKRHSYVKDIIYTGGCTLQGIQYAFANLQKRINFPAVDGDGDALTSGWEDINAFLADVEYDYENDITTLQFSSDHLSLVGQDPEQLKKRLKIRALQLRRIWSVSIFSTGAYRKWSDTMGSTVHADLFAVTQSRDAWVDQETGQESDT